MMGGWYMQKKERKLDLPFLLVCILLAGEIMTAADCVAAFSGNAQLVKLFGALLFLVSAALYALCRKRGRKLIFVAASIMTAAAVILAGSFACWHVFSRNARYGDVDSGKAKLYGDKRIMLIVPHEDDEINLMGGVMEEYLKYGSDVSVVFVTNGDFDFSAEVRIAEAAAAMENVGIPEENLIFLGYGDQWESDGPHLYNAEPGVVMSSAAGRRETYGTEDHPAWREGQAYTSEHLLGDLQSVVLEYRPEVLFCSDYDGHIDHRAVSLAFEKALGRILKEVPDYRPVVLKGYAYGTAWAAEADYYEVNLHSTKNVYAEPVLQEPEIYRWEERIRLPVCSGVLSRSVLSADLYKSLSMHASQGAGAEAVKIINGDKVFWYRDTNSLCYSAEIETSSGNTELLNDFMLVEDHALADRDFLPYDGVWIPAESDGEKKIRIIFADAENIETLVLYDHPSEEHNVLNLEITFDDGTRMQTGALDARGCASRFSVGKTSVAWMDIQLTDWEGQLAGLSEIEVFSKQPEHGMTFVKLMDEEGHFAYDYWTDSDGAALFSLYVSGQALPVSENHYTVAADNPECDVQWTGDRIALHCPEGERCVITVVDRDGVVSDSIVAENPGMLKRAWNGFWQHMEEAHLSRYHQGLHRKTFLYRICSKLLG